MATAAPPSGPYVCDRPVGQDGPCVGRQALVQRLAEGLTRHPVACVLGGPHSGRTTTLQQLQAHLLQRLQRPHRSVKVVPVLLDLLPLSQSAAALSPQALASQLVQQLYRQLAEAVSSPFVQSHRDALRPPKFAPTGLGRGTVADAFAAFSQLCVTLWQAMVGTPGYCRYVLLLDNAEVLLQPAMQPLQAPLRDLLHEPPLPPPPVDMAPPPRELARRAPIKGVARHAATLPQVPGRASAQRRTKAGPPDPVEAVAEIAPTPAAGAAARKKRLLPGTGRRIGHQALGPVLPPGQRAARHLPPDAARPLAMVCTGDAAVLRLLAAARHHGAAAQQSVQPFFAGAQGYPLAPLRPPDADQLVALGDFAAAPAAAQWCCTVAGGHPKALQASLQVLTKRLHTHPERFASANDPQGATLVAALQAELTPMLAPTFARLLATFGVARPGAAVPRAHALMQALLERAPAALTLTDLMRSVGQQRLQPALDLLLMSGVAQRSVRGNVDCVAASCPLFNAYYSAQQEQVFQ